MREREREMLCSVSCYGVVVSMPVLQEGDPGSNPGSSETFTREREREEVRGGERGGKRGRERR